MFNIRIFPYQKSVNLGYYKSVIIPSNSFSNLTFETQNPGGFTTCSFLMNVPFDYAMEIYGNWLGYKISIAGGDGTIAWEGRVEDVTAEPGQASIVGRGRWFTMDDKFYDDGSLFDDPSTSNGLDQLSSYVPIYGSGQQVAQSFQLSEARAIRDIQVRLMNTGMTAGKIYVGLHNDSGGSPGSEITSVEIPVNGLPAAGISEYVNIYTESRLSASTLYWIVVRGASDYWNNIQGASGNDDSGTSSKTYVSDSGTNFYNLGVRVGAQVTNTTDTTTGNVTSIPLSEKASPAKKVYWTQKDLDVGSGRFTDLTNAYDDNLGTQVTVSPFSATNDAIDIGHSDDFGGIEFHVGSSANKTPGDLKAYYANDTEWSELTIVKNTTITDDGVPLGQDGEICWIVPSGWPEDDVNSITGYWVRFELSAASSSFDIEEIYVGRNSRLDFATLNWDNGDQWTYLKCINVGIDSSGSYTSGTCKVYNNGSWVLQSFDTIFYVWGHPKFYYSDGASTYSGDVISDVISEAEFVLEGIFEDNGNVVNPISFKSGERQIDVIDQMTKFGSSDANPEPMSFLIYEDGYARFRKMTSGTTWYVDTSNMPMGQQAFNVTTSMRDLVSKIAVIYSDSVGSRSVTPWIENDALYNKYGYHKEALFSLSGAPEVLAEVLGEIVADIYKNPTQKSEIMVDGFVQDKGMNRWPAWYVRAGDTVILRNVIPQSVAIEQDTVDRVSTIYVQATSYDADTGRLTVTPSDRTKNVIDVIMTLAGLSGGSLS